MDILQQWGLTVAVALQQAGPSWVGLMRAFSFLGSENFFMLVMPTVYWCVDASLGFAIAFLLITSNALNSWLKLALHLPRPYWVDPQVKALAVESSYGAPSGHAQTAVAVWGGLAQRLQRAWMWIVAVGVIALISLSRVYLGVHFPSDVLLGWVLGGLQVWVLARWGDPWIRRLRTWGLGRLIGLALGVSLLYLGMTVATWLALAGSPDPATWAATAAQAAPDMAIDPRSLEAPFNAAGLLFGLGVALALYRHAPSTRFVARGTAWQYVGRFVVGGLGVAVFWLGLKAVFPEGQDALALSLRFVRYTLVVVWALSGAPWVFVRLRLAERAPVRA